MSDRLTVGALRRMLAPGGALAGLPDSAPVVRHGYDEALLQVEHAHEARAQELSGSLSGLSPGEKPTHPQARVRRVMVVG